MITEEERERRRTAMSIAESELRLEGMAPSPDGRAILMRYVEGELTAEETVAAIRVLHLTRHKGPL